MKTEMQELAFMMIAKVGTAKSFYLEALQEVKKADYETAESKIKEGNQLYNEAHQLHFGLLTKEAQEIDLPFSLLFMHAEDQLLSTDTIKIMIHELIDLHKKLDELR